MFMFSFSTRFIFWSFQWIQRFLFEFKKRACQGCSCDHRFARASQSSDGLTHQMWWPSVVDGRSGTAWDVRRTTHHPKTATVGVLFDLLCCDVSYPTFFWVSQQTQLLFALIGRITPAPSRWALVGRGPAWTTVTGTPTKSIRRPTKAYCWR